MLKIDPDRALRTDAWRREPASYPFRDRFRPRFADVDPLQHLNNVALIALHLEACQQLLLDTIGERSWRIGEPMIATLCSSTEYLGEAFYPDPLEAGARLSQVDHQGFTINSALFQRGQCVGVHLARYGCWQAGLPVALPAHLVSVLEAVASEPDALGTAHREPQVAAQPRFGREPDPLVEAAAPETRAFPWRSEMRSRFADREARDIFGDVPLARYAEHIRTEMFHSILRDLPQNVRGRTVVARVDLAFAQRVRPPLEWLVGAGVTRVGGRSVSVRSVLEAGTGCQAVCDAVLVISPAADGSGGMSDRLREALARVTVA